MQKMTRGGESAYEELFQYACPKFITPAPPSLDAPSMNTNQVQPVRASFEYIIFQHSCILDTQPRYC